MEHRKNIFNYLRNNNEEFSGHLRENLAELFPVDSEVVARLQARNYFQTDFYIVIYRTFLLFGWKITSKTITKIPSSNPPFDLAERILLSLNAANQLYFSYLFMLALCQDIFNYAFKSKISWNIFLSWLETQKYIEPKHHKFIKYRWNITRTFSRTFISERLPTIDTSTTPKWKKCIIEETTKAYHRILESMENYPEIQVAFPALEWEEGDILSILQTGDYSAFKKIDITYKKEMYDFEQGDWWVDFANRNLGGGALRSGFVQEEILAAKFPELLYFSSQGYKIPYKGSIVMTNLLKSINFPDSWYGRKNISTKSCWDIVSGIEKETRAELKNFIAIAAIDHSASLQRPFIDYSSEELVAVFNRCYSGFMMAKVLGARQVNSGPLGTGAFNNSPVFMYTLQILAASAVGIDIAFWGAGPNQEISLKTALKLIADKEILRQIPSIVPFKGLFNVGASCYMDSVLFSLLYKNNPIINAQILDKSVSGGLVPLQQELIRVKRSIQGSGEVETCRDLRAILASIPGGREFARHQEQDAGEFLQFLANLFQLQGATVQRNVYGTNDTGDNPVLTITSTFTDYKASLVDFVDSFTLNDVPAGYMLSNFLIKRSDVYLEEPLRDNGRSFIRKITREEIMSVPDFYAFYVQRADPVTNLVLTKPIHPNEAIKFKEKVLQLYSVIIHVGGIDSGHYLVYFKHNDRWFVYNDVSHKIREIGTFGDMLNKSPSPTSRGVIYFYGRDY